MKIKVFVTDPCSGGVPLVEYCLACGIEATTRCLTPMLFARRRDRPLKR